MAFELLTLKCKNLIEQSDTKGLCISHIVSLFNLAKPDRLAYSSDKSLFMLIRKILTFFLRNFFF